MKSDHNMNNKRHVELATVDTPKEENVIKHPTARHYVVETLEKTLEIVKEAIAKGEDPEIYFSIIQWSDGWVSVNRGIHHATNPQQLWALTHGFEALKEKIYRDAFGETEEE